MYRPEAVTVLRAVKAAQRLGFTLDEVAELLEPHTGLAARVPAKLTEVEARLADLAVIRDSLRAALGKGATTWSSARSCRGARCRSAPEPRPRR